MQLITRKQAADRAAISLRHLERLIGCGEGPAIIRLGTRRVAISETDFDAWIASRRHGPPGGLVKQRRNGTVRRPEVSSVDTFSQ
jgi:excisionase family DNA binding protein